MSQAMAVDCGVAGQGLSLADLATAAVASEPAGSWSVRMDGPWCLVSPRGQVLRRQGWKLHLSATPASATAVLEASLPVLVAHCCAFKFAAGMGWAAWLNSPRCPRGAAGKFLTAYPDDDGHFRRLAEALDHATGGLAGPEILSDRRYRPGSIVHYRFGGFTDHMVLDDDGCYRRTIVDPSGRAVDDHRRPWFAPPAWAVPVLAGPAAARTGGPAPVLVGRRFVVRQAIRHSSRGGVFLGSDQDTGTAVVVKQARAHMELDPSGRDCRDLLRHEAELLSLLAPLRLAPRPVTVVEEADHLFLVREHVRGETLRRWVAGHLRGGVPFDVGLRLARALVGLVDMVHRAGLVLVDVSPNNIIVDPTGALWLTDLDHAARAGQTIYPVGTPGYTPPEHLTADGGATARPQADLYGLGGLLFLIAVGADPSLVAADPPARPVSDLLHARLEAAGRDMPLAARFADAVAGLTRDRPDARWRPDQVLRLLHRTGPEPVRAPRERPTGPDPAEPGPVELRRQVDQLVEDGVAHLTATVSPRGERLWPACRSAAATDPCAVQHGAAGILAALVRAAPWVRDPGRVRDVAATATRWIGDRLADEPRLLPGLYFGRSGTAWALSEAAELTGDRQAATTALDLALRVPVEWPNPDVAHGAAGAGMAQLRLWRASGDPRFATRVRECADALFSAAVVREGAITWPIPPALRSRLAGRTFHGYAHGTAGVAAFLLAAGVATERSKYIRLALHAADTLGTAALRQDGAAFWAAGPGREVHADTGWCKGSAGIGTFLLQVWRTTGKPGCLDLARAAALAVYRSRFRATTAHCHGLAGGGHYLLDLAEVLGEDGYRRWAWELAGAMVARAARRGGRLIVPDETGRAVAADYGTGLAGALDFLVRLRHGGPRPWTASP